MSMSGTVLSNKIITALQTAFPDAFPDSGAAQDAWDVIAQAIVEHIQDDAVVTGTAGGDSIVDGRVT